jgi:hypothetical protein
MKDLELTSKTYTVDLTDEEAAVFEAFGRYSYSIRDWVRGNIDAVKNAQLFLDAVWRSEQEGASTLEIRIDAQRDTPEVHGEIQKLLQDFLDRDQAALTGTRRDALPPLVRAVVDEEKITDKDVLTLLVNFGATADGKWRQRLHDFARHVIGNRVLKDLDGISEGLWDEMRAAGWSAADAIAPVIELVRSNKPFYVSDAEKHIQQAITAARSTSGQDN